MKWTKNTPTVPGWYWFREKSAERALVLDVQPLSTGKLAIMAELNRLGADYILVEELNGEWAGPLIPPA
jgi:hypothetical protein